MRISDLLKMGLKNLRRRKARTALTVIGVVIGTISIVVMVSLGIGLNYTYQKSMMEYGSINTLSITEQSGTEDADGNYQEVDQKDKMNDEFVEQLKQIDHVKAVTPVYNTGITVKGSGWQVDGSLTVIDYAALEYMDLPDASLGKYDNQQGTEQLIIGKGALEYKSNPITGNQVTKEVDYSKERMFYVLNDWDFPSETEQKKKVISNFVMVDDENNFDFQYNIYMDLTYFKKIYKDYVRTGVKSSDQKKAMNKLKNYSEIKVIVDNANNVDDVITVIKDMGATATGMGTYVEEAKKQAKVLELILGGIGAVAMFVSAISIANTMIMSIYERTKEIGIMKVLGCVVGDIRKLFLLEAGTIGLIGGVAGIIFSYLISYCINHLGAGTIGAAMGLTADENGSISLSIIPVWLALAALAFAFLIGLISGYYPAKRATKISSIEAMKTEG